MRKYTILVMILAIGFMFGGTSYADLNDGLVAYYPFNGNANDESGNEYHGEEYGNIGYVAGKLNKAAIFDGIDDFILVPHNSDLEFGTKSFSISFWMNTSVIPSSRPYIIDKDHSYHSTGLYRFTLEPSGSNDTPAAFFIQRGSTYFDATGSVPVTDGDWHHIVGVRDAEKGVIKLYCDGKEETSTTEFPILDTSSGYPLAFGASSGTHPTSGKHVSFYNGLIDEIRIYNRALSEAEIQELADVESPYKKGDIIINIKDEEGNPLNGYLLVKLPPPVVYPKDLQLEFYPYFHNSALVEESLNGVQNYVLKWFYVSGGKIHFSIYDIEDYIWVTDPGVWVRSPDHQLTLNDTRFIFFYETNEQFNDETIEDKISKTNGGNVTWWTLNYRENDTDPLIQNATLIKKNQSGEQIYDWTYGIFCSGIGQCYFPNHIDRQNFVLEPPYQDGSSLPDSIYNGDKDPVVLIHGINGQAGYWEDNVLRLRNDVDTMNTWVFNYRGTENIANCAYLLKLAIKGIRNFYSNTKKVNLVTHSYGGVITRKYCINYNNEAAKNISKILMLGPPHHGSYGAQRIYTRDALALNQRIWVFQKWTLDPMSPVYKELTPGSNSLMEMVGEKFPSGTQVFIVAGTKTGVAGIFHDEAPNHDDGVVSISSASLLPLGIPLGFTYKDHEGEKSDEDMASLISQFIGNRPIPIGENQTILYIIEDRYPRLSPPSYHDQYPQPSLFDKQRLDRAGLIVDCRKFNSEIDKVKLFSPAEGKFVKQLSQHPDGKDVFYYNDQFAGLGGKGLAYKLNFALYEKMVLYFYCRDKEITKRDITLYPCSTNIVALAPHTMIWNRLLLIDE